MIRLDGKVAIVTGGAQGVGGGISRCLARSGAKVLIADIDIATAEDTAKQINDSGSEASVLKVDVTSFDDLKNMIGVAQSKWGKLDILVNNAYNSSDAQRGGLLEVSEEQWQKDINSLVTSVYAGSKYAIPVMAETGGGSIVNISSVHGLLVAKKALTYETGKSAVIALTKQIAVDPAGLKFFADQYPVKRTGTPEDIGNAAVFLSSDLASFITGHALPVDGGLTIQLQENFGVQQVHYVKDHPETEMPYKR